MPAGILSRFYQELLLYIPYLLIMYVLQSDPLYPTVNSSYPLPKVTIPIDSWISNFDFDRKLEVVSSLLEQQLRSRHHIQKRTSSQKTRQLAIISHNINGNAGDEASMTRRMQEWRSTSLYGGCDIIFLQETHIASSTTAIRLDNLWLRGWGLSINDSSSTRKSWWSIGSRKSAGVAVIMSPQLSGSMQLIDKNNWNSRRLAVKYNNIIFVNIYAPTIKCERESFFQELSDWMFTFQCQELVLVGDFNCCEHPLFDRQFLPNRSYVTESPALGRLVSRHQFSDTFHVNLSSCLEHKDENLLLQESYHTYYRTNCSSRIDRIYATGAIVSQVVTHFVYTSGVHSDHRIVGVHLVEHDTITTGLTESKIYPHTMHNTKLVRKIIAYVLEYIRVKLCQYEHKHKVWDLGKLLLQHIMGRLKTHDRRHI